jgi:glycosyltransferase involved in cell wall biosynthesis
VQHAKIVHLGTQAEHFMSAGKRYAEMKSATENSATEKACTEKSSDSPLGLLYVGRLTATKGVHTAISALAKALQAGSPPITLDIVGKGEPDYEQFLRKSVQQMQLDHAVRFQGGVPHSEMPEIMARYDILLFPSEWEEPFAHTVLEAMAAGLAVIGTATGGTPEVLIDGKTGLLYRAGDADGLARQILRLHQNQSLRQQLAQAGQAHVLQHFTLQQTVDKLEEALQEATLRKA